MAVAALAALVAALAIDEPPAPSAPAPKGVEASEPPAPRGAGDGARRADTARRPDGMRWRGEGPMPAEMAERVIAVARDVSPEFAERLERARDASPEQMGQAMRQSARRLVALAIVKDRNPALYSIRVEELRLQLELRALGEEFRAASAAGDAAKASSVESRIAAKARAQVDIDLKARAQELLALDEQVRTLRDELADEQRRTDERVVERIDAVKSGQPLPDRAGADGPGGRPRPDSGAEDGAPRAPARPRADA